MNRKGFTLIELLAVIVILSIILLIAVPIVLKVIKDSKKTTAKDSLELYGRAVENGVANYFLKNPEEDEVSLKDLEDGGYLQYKGTKIECDTVEILHKEVYLANCKVGETYIEGSYGIHNPSYASKLTSFIGYYADVDGDGTADGIIYADLAFSKSGKWGLRDEEYSYEALEDLKEYTISETKYTGENAKFGEKEIITLKPNSTGNKRFYVMALSDFTTEAYIDPNNSNNNYPVYKKYSWYENTYDNTNDTGRMPNRPKDTKVEFGTGYENTGTMIRIWNNNGEEEGWTTGATQDNQDIWKHIQGEYAKGWYIPSYGEWLAFADYLAHKGENPLTTSNYNSTYGLGGTYWSSSQYDNYGAWVILFFIEFMNGAEVMSENTVRLGATF